MQQVRRIIRNGVLVVAVALGLTAVPLQFSPVDLAGPAAQNPLAGRPLYVDPESSAKQALRADPADAAAISVLADTPQARWFTETTPAADVARAVSDVVGGAAATGAMPTLVAYAIPLRDCAGYTQGGVGSAAGYAEWIRQFRVGISGRPATVILEPDALAAIDCIPEADRNARIAMLKDATDELAADPSTAVYIDAGHSRWLDPATIAERLGRVGIGAARGFSVNVSNFFGVDEEVAYGERVSALLGGKAYVVDTSRNGLGPAPDGPENWCNPPGRAVGPRPTTATAGSHADAYLWIKNPGESDGECGRGDPASGLWYEQYAVGLAQRSQP